jgi:spore germination cell wall hydrolase CwlJ-like protein
MTYINIVKMFLLLPIIVFGLCSASPRPQQQEIEQPQVAKQVDKKEIQCLADNIYYEAGGESTEGKAAVARVVLNRVSHGFAPTPCKVVYQTNTVKQTNEDDESFWVKVCQFSWVCEGKGNPNRNSQRYQTSLQVAKDVLVYDKYKDVIPKTVLFFHNTTVVNNYPHEVVARIGNHIFYKKKHGKNRKKSGKRFVQSPRVSGDAQVES